MTNRWRKARGEVNRTETEWKQWDRWGEVIFSPAGMLLLIVACVVIRILVGKL
jgi:hypothetical protein